MSIKGVVSKVSSNHYNNKELWSFRLRGDNNYYNTGEIKPHVLEGQSIEFETKLSPSGKHTALLDTVREWKPDSDVPLTNTPVRGFVKSFKKDPDKDLYWANKEARDIKNDKLRELGATRNTAISFVEMLIKVDGLKLPAAQNKKEEVLFEAVNHYTEKFLKTHTEEPSAGEEQVGATASVGEPDESWS